MSLIIPYSAEDATNLIDVIARLGVLYPDLEITHNSGNIIIKGMEPSVEATVKQAAHDQLIRSRFDASNVALRNCLYSKLLG